MASDALALEEPRDRIGAVAGKFQILRVRAGRIGIAFDHDLLRAQIGGDRFNFFHQRERGLIQTGFARLEVRAFQTDQEFVALAIHFSFVGFKLFAGVVQGLIKGNRGLLSAKPSVRILGFRRLFAHLSF